MLRPLSPAGCGEGRGAWRRALGGSVREGREGGCSSGLRAGAGQGRHSWTALPTGTWGSPRPARALGLGGCPHQALSDPPRLLGLQQVSELFPLEELCCSKEGFPGGLQSSRSWEMAPWPGQGDLASPSSWLCSWSDPALRKLGHGLAQTSGALLGTALGDRD